MKIVQLITDEREHHRNYHLDTPYFGTAPSALLQGFAMLPEVEVHIVSCTKRSMTSPEKLADNIFFHSVVARKIGWLRTGYQGCIRAARRKIQEIQPDIVHGQGTERDSAISATFSGFPNVLTLHGNMRLVAKVKAAGPFTFLWWAALLEQFTLPRANGVVCITNYTREAVENLARKTWVVPNAVDASFFDLATSPAPTPRILCVGMVEPRKNQNELIRAIDTLDLPAGFELVILGVSFPETSYGREFLELVAKRPWCRYVGFADREALKKHFATATGLVLASLEDNCPMVVLEAMASGVPVAAPRVGGVPDLVRDGENGLLLDPLDRNSIASAMKILIRSGNEAMAARAREEARQRYYPRLVAARHVEIYREVLATSPRRAAIPIVTTEKPG